MLPQATFALMHVEDASAAINYGLNKVRFPGARAGRQPESARRSGSTTSPRSKAGSR